MRNGVSILVAALASAIATGFVVLAVGDLRLGEERAARMRLAAETLALRRQVEALQRTPRLGAPAPSPIGARIEEDERPGAAPTLDDPEALRAFVLAVVAESRQQRIADLTTGQPERMRAWQAARGGDFGALSPRVDAMTRALELDAGQAQYYGTLLEDFAGRAEALYADAAAALGADIDSMEALERALADARAGKEALDAELDDAFLQTLSESQRQRFGALPLEARGLGPDAGLAALEVNFDGLSGLAADPGR